MHSEDGIREIIFTVIILHVHPLMQISPTSLNSFQPHQILKTHPISVMYWLTAGLQTSVVIKAIQAVRILIYFGEKTLHYMASGLNILILLDIHPSVIKIHMTLQHQRKLE